MTTHDINSYAQVQYVETAHVETTWSSPIIGLDFINLI